MEDEIEHTVRCEYSVIDKLQLVDDELDIEFEDNYDGNFCFPDKADEASLGYSDSDNEEPNSPTEQHDGNHDKIVTWFALMFFWVQAKFNLTSKAVSHILILVAGLLSVVGHPIFEIFPWSLHNLKKLFPEFRSLLASRFHQQTAHNILEDVWDGSMWSEFQYDPSTGRSFLREENNIAFMLSVDWVKPFKREQYHFGVVSLVALNLLRADRQLTLPAIWKSRLGKKCAAFEILSDKVFQEEYYSEYCQILRLKAEKFLAANGIDLNDAFMKQCKIEMMQSEFPFLKAKLLPPMKSSREMDGTIYSTGDEDNQKFAKITMSLFGNLEPFEGGEFPTYKERLEAFFVANNIGIVPEDATDAVVQAAE
eukprot:gene16080-7429_t